MDVWSTNATTGYAYVKNVTTGLVLEYELTPPAGTKLVGNTAEWIIEAPQVNNVQSTLAAYGTDFFWAAGATNFAKSSFNPGSSVSVQIDLDHSSTILSSPAPLNTTTLQLTYK